jgi:hypothetical protein
VPWLPAPALAASSKMLHILASILFCMSPKAISVETCIWYLVYTYNTYHVGGVDETARAVPRLSGSLTELTRAVNSVRKLKTRTNCRRSRSDALASRTCFLHMFEFYILRTIL